MYRLFRFWHLRMVRQRDSRHNIALGVSVGLLVGFVVPMGPQMIIAFIIASLLKCNRPLALASTFVSNPFTVGFLYPFQTWLGSVISRMRIPEETVLAFKDAGENCSFFEWEFAPMAEFLKLYGSEILTKILVNFFIGGFILAVISIAICYPLILRAIDRHKVHKALRVRKRREKRRLKLKKMLEAGKITQEYFDHEMEKFAKKDAQLNARKNGGEIKEASKS